MISKEAVLSGHQRLNSRFNPTVMARISLYANKYFVELDAYAPSGASKGTREALELLDGDQAYGGKGVSKAVENISKIAGALSGLMVTDQRAVDTRMRELDGTDNKSNLGANAMLAVSMAVARAGAEYRRTSLFHHISEMMQVIPEILPTPLINVVNGGAHARNGLPFQEFMIVPVGAEDFTQAMKMSSEVYGKLGELIQAPGVGDEGGYAPVFSNPTEDGIPHTYQVLRTLVDAIGQAGYEPGRDVAIALDVAASEFYKDGKYHLDRNTELRSGQMVGLYMDLVSTFPIISIEDGMAEGDLEGWKVLTGSEFGKGLQIVGDDVFVTNPDIFRQGIKDGIANAILVKLNQIGTVSETLDVIRMARENGYETIISHRSGETEDTFIADLAVGTRSRQIKTGSARGERTAKYNRLSSIAENIANLWGMNPIYAGNLPFTR